MSFHNRDYPAHLLAQHRLSMPIGSGCWGRRTPTTVAEVLAASDLHIAPGRSYPVARSVLEAMAAGCVVMASDTAPHREIITTGQTGLLIDGEDTDALAQALAVLADPAAHRPLGDAAADWCASGTPGCVPASAR